MANLKTPILYLVFNRPELVKRTFVEIQKAKPVRLFIAADGPRDEEEKKKTDEVRQYILKNINWKCEVKTLFRKKNLGCKNAVSSAITWFFENVEGGIILEDDCLPDRSFFRYCQELLIKYKNNKNIMHIGGSNFCGCGWNNNSYYFSKYPHIWGWATWRGAWEGYDKNVSTLTNDKIKRQYPSLIEQKFMLKRFERIKLGISDTWDYQWMWNIKINNGICITPTQNMVGNIGFSDEASSHTSKNFWDNFFVVKKVRATSFPLKHPKKIKLSSYQDKKELCADAIRVILKKLF